MSPVPRASRPQPSLSFPHTWGNYERPSPEELWRGEQAEEEAAGHAQLSHARPLATSPPPPYFSGRIDDVGYTSINLQSPTSPPPAYSLGENLGQALGPAARQATPRAQGPPGAQRPSNRAIRRAQRRSGRRSRRRARCTAGGFPQDPVSLPQTPLTTTPWCEWGGPLALLPTYSESELDQPPPYTALQPAPDPQPTPYSHPSPPSPSTHPQPIEITMFDPDESEWEDPRPAHAPRRPRISSRELNRVRLRGDLIRGASAHEPSWRGASKVCTHVAIAALMVFLILVLVLFWH
ncbi:membrane protein [pteropodid alphaherpesvirus 2]|uniref:Membrane protein n=1 Tax=pteropodid alphaherpesvirus 2 TaxID=3118716 RepID=A0A510J978_9ALPH|nr:membrane protein [pteropodid alphaherpesvirus 2]BBM13229.1 membrane protein [pteropodid alphaherpesvirus 2]